MSKTLAKFINYDPQSLTSISNALTVLLDAAGALEKTNNGINVKAAGIAYSMLADGATIARTDLTRTISAIWDFGSNLPTASADPTSANQLVRKAYVDAAIQGLDVKASVRAASTANLTLSGTQTVDGVVLIAGDRILVKDQSSGAQNGIYVVAAGAWSRATDADTAAKLSAGTFVFVEEGTVNADTGWVLTTDGTITLGTTALAWVQFSGAGQVIAGAGLTKTGNTIDFVAGNNSLTVGADSVTVNVNPSFFSVGGSGITLVNGAITATQINSSALGNGLTGGSGTAISVVASAFITGGSVEIDGDKLNITWDPTNYTPATVATFSTSVDDLTSHLKGIDTKLGQLSVTRRVETFTLAAGDITNKYVTLANAPAAAGRVILLIKGAPAQFYGDDYAMDGTVVTRVTWNGLALDGVLASGDKLTVEYDA
jgi:hypothetical protein